MAHGPARLRRLRPSRALSNIAGFRRTWTIPMNDARASAPREHRTHVNGADLVWFEWNEPASEVVLLVHATGFHARCWDRVVASLGGAYAIAVDMRGHGRSDNAPPFGWDTFGRDLAELVETLDLAGVVGVGHSMGGHSVTQAAATHPERFDRLVLIDPVILDPQMYATRQAEGPADPAEHPTARRRNRWASWQEMYERFRDRRPFAHWDPRVLEDYCRYGIVPAPDGDGYVLACPPEVESAIYTGSAMWDIYAMIERIELPVTVLRAQERAWESDPMDFASSPTWPALAERFPHGRDVYLPELTHFMPMERPALVAEYVQGLR